MTIRSLTEQIRKLRFWSVIVLICIGCTPVMESDKPARTSSSITSPSDKSLSAKTTTAENPHKLARLLVLIRERLELMPQVAQAKWNRKVPITDPKREATLLDAIEVKGAARGLRADVVRAFFQAQITAAKLIQERHFADWTIQQKPPFKQPPDLEREIRPKIDKLNDQLLEALRESLAERSSATWKHDLDRTATTVFEAPQWPAEVVKAALEPLYR